MSETTQWWGQVVWMKQKALQQQQITMKEKRKKTQSIQQAMLNAIQIWWLSCVAMFIHIYCMCSLYVAGTESIEWNERATTTK